MASCVIRTTLKIQIQRGKDIPLAVYISWALGLLGTLNQQRFPPVEERMRIQCVCLCLCLFYLNSLHATLVPSMEPSHATLVPTMEPSVQTNRSMKILVGGYHAEITTLEYNPATATVKNQTSTRGKTAGLQPSFLGFSPDGRHLFSVNEVANFRALNQTGSVSSWEVQPDGRLRLLSTGLTGPDPVSLAVSPDGKSLITAEYSGGSWSRFSLNQSAQFTSPSPVQTRKYLGSGPVKDRQNHSYLHQVVYNKAGDLVFFVDLGGDSVYIHRVDQLAGQVGEEIAHEIKVPAGTGPRHLSVVENGEEYDVYLICELSNKIITIRLVDQHSTLNSTIRQQLSTLPAEYANTSATANTSTFGAGEVLVSRDGRFVYGSNRQTDLSRPGDENTIVVFGRDPLSGLLGAGPPAWFPLTERGKTPRHFSFSGDLNQSLVLVGCQQSDTLLVLHRNSSDGRLNLLASAPVPAPTVQLFLPNISTAENTSLSSHRLVKIL